MRFFPRCPHPLAVMAMSAIGNWRSGNIRGEEVASLPLMREERHEVVVIERKVREGVSSEEIWREYEAARLLLSIAEATGDEKRAETQRERVEMLESELREAVMDENLIEDLRGWC
ncbi:MAG: hypothetical protein DRN54_03995 [Thaumarchaeota archaeon]|nr:MAG: hypothetical protein DRN54_03995 [Nitrososphaerota archaeon]